jgi:oxygen-independent coproporphyrinogen-3 oxidase
MEELIDAATRDFLASEQVSPDEALIRRLSAPAPRYTSYPPANYFTDGFDPDGIYEEIASSSRCHSLYVHIPYCRKRCFFCGCNTTQRRQYGDTPETVDALITEIKTWARRFPRQIPLTDIHWGGGTPNFLQPNDLLRLGESLHENFTISKETTFSVEIDPRELEDDQAPILGRIGCRRASLGVQDTQQVVQEAIGRIQPFAVTEHAVTSLRAAGIKAINVDLIYGLPFQTRESFRDTIQEVLTLKPDRFAIFGYAHLPSRLSVQKVIDHRGGLPDALERYQLLLLAIEELGRAGYVHLGLDHFARPEDPLAQLAAKNKLRRNFNGYTDQPASELMSVGPSAISQSDTHYAQNEKEPLVWKQAIEHGQSPIRRGLSLTAEDKCRRVIVDAILTRDTFSVAQLESESGLPLSDLCQPGLSSLNSLETDRLLTPAGDGFRLLPRGRLFRRLVAQHMDLASQDEKTGLAPLHSSAV